MTHRKKKMSAGFIVIILFKFFKGLIFLLFGIAALKLLRPGPLPSAREIAHFLSVSPENEFIRRVADVIREITPRQATGIAVGAFGVAAVFFAEAAFLTARIWWSTYLTVVLAACGIPLEILEIIHKPWSGRRYLLLAVNAAILAYVWTRRNEFKDTI